MDPFSREMSDANQGGGRGAYDYSDMFGANNLRQLWFLYIVITTRTNPSNPEVMRKRELVKLMRNCQLLKVNGSSLNPNLKIKQNLKQNKKPVLTKENNPHDLVFSTLMEAEINVIHQAEESRTYVLNNHTINKKKRFTWSAFLRSLVTIASKVYKENPNETLAQKKKKKKKLRNQMFFDDFDENREMFHVKHDYISEALQLLITNHILPETQDLVNNFLNEKGYGLLPIIGKKLMFGQQSQSHSQQGSSLNSLDNREKSYSNETDSQLSIIDNEIDNEELIGLINLFTPCLKLIFSYFGNVPTHDEMLKGRHPMRSDISHLHQVLEEENIIYLVTYFLCISILYMLKRLLCIEVNRINTTFKLFT